MDTLFHVLGLIVLYATCLLALATLLFGLPGTFLIVAIKGAIAVVMFLLLVAASLRSQTPFSLP
jgi:hypothetical protein